MVICTGVV